MIQLHATGTHSAEATTFFSGVADVTAAGGVVISPETSTGQGSDISGTGIWTADDLPVFDQLVGCALAQQNIDVRRIYVTGTSSGGIAAAAMAYQRSGYIAAVLTYSGGLISAAAATLQDASHVPAAMTMHGAKGTDVVGVDFSTTSLTLDHDVADKGGFAVDCDYGGAHAGAPTELRTDGWQFLKDHPFAVSPEPYASGLPGFPETASIIMSNRRGSPKRSHPAGILFTLVIHGRSWCALAWPAAHGSQSRARNGRTVGTVAPPEVVRAPRVSTWASASRAAAAACARALRKRCKKPLLLDRARARAVAVTAGAVAGGRLLEQHVRSAEGFATREIEVTGLARLSRAEVLDDGRARARPERVRGQPGAGARAPAGAAMDRGCYRQPPLARQLSHRACASSSRPRCSSSRRCTW